MLEIRNEDISFVVQGPVQASHERKQIDGVTVDCLASIRHYFPRSTIILSTWKGQKTEGLDYDHLLELDDPGQNSVFTHGKELKLNNNRQLYSSHMGLKAVKTPYAAKIRTDNLLSGRGFVDLFAYYHDKDRVTDNHFFDSRVVTSSAFFISHHRGAPNYFCKSDLFDFGLTSDLLKIWSDKPVKELHFKPKVGYKSRPPATEQFLVLKWLSELMGIDLEVHNRVNDHAGLGEDFWERFIANNLIIGTPEEIGLDTTVRFYQRGNLVFEYDLNDWQELAGFKPKTWSWKKTVRFVRNMVENTYRRLYRFLPTQKTSKG
ncbi:WavE lipopolysaccharide synthesis family protein [Enterovibrio sp. 27052020O]|uniref:WavE lipopolysaccharide synthesis family protein n=1 Tax=Enterovibrio sp. 27052020O TaxID=3241166 RepID=UPI00388E9840